MTKSPESPLGIKGSKSVTYTFLAGGGEMGDLIRAYDWASTSVGAIESWPQSLKTTIKTILGSRYPMILLWGDDLLQFYNDAYTSLIGDKHPYALGRSIRETQAESWEVIGPMIHDVMSSGIPNWVPAQMLPLNRAGFREESYFSLSYSAVENDLGRIEGMLCVCSEVTQQVIGERRLRLQRDLAAKTSEVRNVELAGNDIAKIVAEYPQDIPFALIYLRQADSTKFVLHAQTGLSDKTAYPAVVDMDQWKNSSEPWSFAKAIKGKNTLINNVERYAQVVSVPFNDKVTKAYATPVGSVAESLPAGILIVGISPNHALDENYSSFYELLAGQVSTTIRNALAHEEERKRVEALAELDRAKTAFFSNISHEFRTPLTLMLGPLEEALSESEDKLKGDQRERLELIHRNSLRLQNLVNTLLNFSRIEAGRIEANYQKTDLAQYTKDLAGAFRSAIEKAGLELIVDSKPVRQQIYVDQDMWEKIVLNLLSNALKFTFEGHIKVALSEKDESVVLQISDTGTGIAQKELPNLFKRFYRIQGAKSRTHEGSGIGLAFVQELVKMHGGTIKATSKLHKGTTFTVTIPTGKSHLPESRITAEAATDERLSVSSAFLVDEAMKWTVDTGLLSFNDAADVHDKDVLSGAQQARILVVDDNDDMRTYVKRILSKNAGWNIQTVANGKQALALIEENQPDLVLTDIMMPEMDGLELARKLRADDNTKNTPIIFLSARAGEEAKVEGLAVGVDDYLVKPFSARELIARVKTHLEIARIRQNVSELEKAKDALRESKERFRVVSDNATTGLFVMDHRQYCVFMNPAAEAMTGYELKELLTIDKPLHDIIHHLRPDGSHYPLQDCPIDRALPQKSKISGEDTLVRPDGTFYPVAFMASPIIKDGKPVGTVIEVRDVTEEKKAENELRELMAITEQRNALLKINKTKDEFIALASHQLRTPATAVKQYIGLLMEDYAGPLSVDQTKYLQIAYDSNERELSIINDLLKTAQIDSTKYHLNKQRHDIVRIVDECILDMKSSVRLKEQTITLDKPAKAVKAFVDEMEMKLVFINLLENASKYSYRGTEIKVVIKCVNGFVEVSFADKGVGISKDNQQRIFDKFTRVNNELSDTVTGTGLGLYWVKQIVELHGGVMRLDSSLGQGSTFTLRLPQ